MAYRFTVDRGRTKTGINIATNCYTKEDVLRLIRVLETKYRLKSSAHTGNRIYIKTSSCTEFIDIVRPYIHSDMSYKLAALKK